MCEPVSESMSQREWKSQWVYMRDRERGNFKSESESSIREWETERVERKRLRDSEIIREIVSGKKRERDLVRKTM